MQQDNVHNLMQCCKILNYLLALQVCVDDDDSLLLPDQVLAQYLKN